MKIKNVILAALLIVSLSACNQKKNNDSAEKPVKENTTEANHTSNQQIFPKGKKAPSKYFTGTAYVYNLVQPDSVYTTSTGNVHFEAGARSHWHSHASGQILIVTSGKGYHQIKGKEKEIIKKGDVVKCPPNTTHWHGASENASMDHIYIVPNTEKGVVEWKEPVSDKTFRK